jgi:PAS domain S-box-containing protein
MEAPRLPHHTPKAPRLPAFFRTPGMAGAAGWAALVLIASLGVTAVVFTASRSAAEAEGRIRFDFATSRIAAAVGSRLGDYIQVLWGGVGLFAAEPDIRDPQWQAYFEAIRLPERLPGIRSVAYLRHLLPSDKAAHEQAVREQGMPDYSVWPEGEREAYAALTYIAPFDPQRQRVFGFDSLSEPVRRAGVERARDSGTAAMSGQLRLVSQVPGREPVGFTIYLPIYRAGAPVGTVAERRVALTGIVAGSFRVAAFMRDALTRLSDAPILPIEVYDGSTTEPAALIYRSEDWTPEHEPAAGAAPATVLVTQIVAGRPWTFRFRAPDLAAAPDQQRPAILLAGGVLASLLASSMVFILLLNRAQAVEANRMLSADVARRETVEAQLRESEAKFRLLFANSPLPMWAWDRATLRFLEVNNAAIVKYGYSRAEFDTMRLTDIRPAEDLPHLMDRLSREPRSDPRTFESRHKLRDGRIIDVEITAHDIELGGRPAVLVVAHDIGESKRAREALRESEQMARGIIDAALDGFVQIDQTGNIVEWNPRAEAIFGWSREDAVGMPFDTFIALADERLHYRNRFVHAARNRANTPGARLEVDALRRDGGKIRVEVTVTTLAQRRGYLSNCFVRDLTEKIAAEEQLRQAQKMEAVGKLTGGIAHDFNNILTVITGTIEILAEAVADRPKLSAVARMIEEAAERGAALTRHLLAFARKQPLQPCPTDVNALVVDAARLFEPALGEDVEIAVLPQADAWRALVDPSQLTTSLLNLAVNARDAMPGGGKLTLETGNVMLDEHYADSNADVRPGPYVRIAVSDTGTGIPTAIQDKVFEPFFTTKEVGKGTGLGLSMVYGFVKQSGGHIKLYSEEGRGTTVNLYLPRAQAAPQPGEKVVATAPLAGGWESILVVEDDALVRDYVIAQLASLGYRTCAAVNAAEALALVDAGEHFDLLFTDVIMPGGMNGKELAEAIAARRGPVKVLFTAGYTENSVVHHGRLDAGVTLLSKPYRKTELASRVREILDREALPVPAPSASA